MAHSRISNTLRSAGINFIGMGMRLMLSFVVSVLAARYLGRVRYGEVAIGTTILTSVSTLTMVGLGQGVSTFLPRSESVSEQRDILFTASIVLFPVSIITTIIIILSAEFLASTVFGDPSLTQIIRICALGIPLANLGQISVSIIRGNKQTVPKVIIDDLTIQVSRVLFIIAFAIGGLGTVYIAGAYTLSLLISGALGFYYVFKYTDILCQLRFASIRYDLVKFSFPLWISAGMSVIYSGTDTFFIAYFSGTESVGIYNVVYPLAHHLSIAMISIGYIALPSFSELYSGGKYDEIKNEYQSVTEWVFVVTLPLFLLLIFMPKTILSLLFGQQYSVGYLALSILSIGFFIQAITGPTSDIIKSVGASRLIVIDGGLTAITNVGLNIILIPSLDYVGAAISTTLSYSILTSLYSYQAYSKTGAQPFSKRYSILCVVTICIITFRVLTIA